MSNLLSSGFNKQRRRELRFYDCGNFSAGPCKTVSLGSGSGILMPLYDHDTRLLVLAGKGDVNTQFMEVTNDSPY